MSDRPTIHLSRRGSINITLPTRGGAQGTGSDGSAGRNSGTRQNRRNRYAPPTSSRGTKLPYSRTTRTTPDRQTRGRAPSDGSVNGGSADLKHWGLRNPTNTPDILRATADAPQYDWLKSHIVDGSVEFPDGEGENSAGTGAGTGASASSASPATNPRTRHADGATKRDRQPPPSAKVSSSSKSPSRTGDRAWDSANKRPLDTQTVSSFKARGTPSPSKSASKDFESFLSDIQSDLQSQYREQQQRLSPPKRRDAGKRNVASYQPSQTVTDPVQKRPAASSQVPESFQQETTTHTPQPTSARPTHSPQVHINRRGSIDIQLSPSTAKATRNVSPEYRKLKGEGETRKEVLSAIEELALNRLRGTCKDGRRILRMFDQKQLTLDGSPPWRGNSNLIGTSGPGTRSAVLTSPGAAQTAAGAANLCRALRSNLEQELRHAVAIGIDDEHPTILEGRRLVADIAKLVASGALVLDTGDGGGAADHYERQARERRRKLDAEAEALRQKSLSQVDKLREKIAADEATRKEMASEISALKNELREKDEAADRAADEQATLQADISALEHLLTETRDEAQTLRSELGDKTREATELTEELNRSQAESASLADTLNASLTEAYAKVGTLEANNTDLQRKIAALQRERDSLQATASRLKEHLLQQVQAEMRALDTHEARLQATAHAKEQGSKNVRSGRPAEHQPNMPQSIHSQEANSGTASDGIQPYDDFQFVQPSVEELKAVNDHLHRTLDTCTAANIDDSEIADAKRRLAEIQGNFEDSHGSDGSDSAGERTQMIDRLQDSLNQLTDPASNSGESAQDTARRRVEGAFNILREACDGIPPKGNRFSDFIAECAQQGKVQLDLLANANDQEVDKLETENEKLTEHLRLEQAEVVRLGDALNSLDAERDQQQAALNGKLEAEKRTKDDLQSKVKVLTDQVNFAVGLSRKALENVLRKLMDDGHQLLPGNDSLVAGHTPELAATVCPLLREVIDDISALGFKFPTQHDAKAASNLLEDAEQLLQLVRAAGDDASSLRERHQQAVLKTLGGVVRVADGAVNSAGPDGIDSAELCQLEDMIFDAACKSILSPVSGLDNNDDVAAMIENLEQIRKGLHRAHQNREKNVLDAHEQSLNAVENEVQSLKDEVAREQNDALEAATSAHAQRQDRALARLARFLEYCRNLELDGPESVRSPPSDAVVSALATIGITSVVDVELWRPRTAELLLGEEIRNSLNAGVSADHPLVVEANDRQSALHALAEAEAKRKLDDVRTDLASLQLSVSGLESHRGGLDDHSRMDTDGLSLTQAVIAAAAQLNSSLTAALPFATAGNDDLIQDAKDSLDKALALLSNNLAEVANSANEANESLARVPQLQDQLKQAQADAASHSSRADAVATENAAQAANIEELKSKLQSAEEQATRDAENMQQQLDSKDAELKQEQDDHAATRDDLSRVASEKAAAEAEIASAAEDAEARAQAAAAVEEEERRAALERLKQCQATVSANLAEVHSSIQDSAASIQDDNSSSGGSVDPKHWHGQSNKAAAVADGIRQLQVAIQDAKDANCAEDDDVVAAAEEYLRSLQTQHESLESELEEERERLRQKLELLRRSGRSLLAACGGHASTSSVAGVIVDDVRTLVDDDVESGGPGEEPADPSSQQSDGVEESASHRRSDGAANDDVSAKVRIEQLQQFEAEADALLQACDGILQDEPLSADATRVADAKHLQREAHALALKLSSDEIRRLEEVAAHEAAATRAAVAADKTATLEQLARDRENEVRAMQIAHEQALADERAALLAKEATALEKAAAAEQALKEAQERAEAEKAAASAAARKRANELMSAAIQHAEEEVQWALEAAEKWQARAQDKEHSGFAGDGSEDGTVDAVAAFRKSRSNQSPIPVTEIFVPSIADVEQIALILEDYSMVNDCAERLRVAAESDLIDNAIQAEESEPQLAERARGLRSKASELASKFGNLSEERNQYFDDWHAYADASKQRARELLLETQAKLQAAAKEANVALSEVKDILNESAPDEDWDNFEPAKELRCAIEENAKLQHLVSLLLDDDNEVSAADLIAGMQAVVAATAAVLSGSSDPEADRVRREVVENLVANLTGGRAGGAAALQESISRGKRLEARVKGMAHAMQNELADLERAMAEIEGDSDSEGSDDDSGVAAARGTPLPAANANSEAAQEAADELRRLQEEYEALQKEIATTRDEFEQMQSTIGQFVVPEDESPEDGVLGADYVAELAGDESADDGIINFDDLLAHDGRDLQAALTTRASVSSPFARPRIVRKHSAPETLARRLTAEFSTTQKAHPALRSMHSMVAGEVVTTTTPRGTRRTTVDFKLTYVRRFVQKALIHLRYALNTEKGRDVIRAEVRAHGSKRAAKEHIVKALVAQAESKADRQFGALHTDENGHRRTLPGETRETLKISEALKRKEYLEGLSATEVVEKRERASLVLMQLMEKEQKVLEMLATRRRSALYLLAEDEQTAAAEIERYQTQRKASIKALQVHTRRASQIAAVPGDEALRRASAMKLPLSPAPFPGLPADEESDDKRTSSAAESPGWATPQSKRGSRRLSSVETSTLRRLSSKGLLPEYMTGDISASASAAAAAAAASTAADAFEVAHATAEAWRHAETWFDYVRLAVTESQLVDVWAATLNESGSTDSPPNGPDNGDVTASAIHVALAKLMSTTLEGAPKFEGSHAAEAAEVADILWRLQQADTIEAVRKRQSDALLFGMLMLDDEAIDADDAGADSPQAKALRDAETPRTAARNFTVVSRRRFVAYSMQALEQLISLELVDAGVNDEIGDLIRDAEQQIADEAAEAAEELAAAADGGVRAFPDVEEEGDVVPVEVPSGPHFGVPLVEVATDSETNVPTVLAQLWEGMREQVSEDGVFRVSGENRKYGQLIETLDKGGTVEIAPEDVHIVANVIKIWLRRLPGNDKLLADIDVAAIVDAIAALPHRSSDAESTREGLDSIIEPMLQTRTKTQRATLEFVLGIGLVVAAQSTLNKMTKSNFAVCVAPNLYPPMTADAMSLSDDIMKQVLAQKQLFIYLLDWYEEKHRNGN